MWVSPHALERSCLMQIGPDGLWHRVPPLVAEHVRTAITRDAEQRRYLAAWQRRWLRMHPHDRAGKDVEREARFHARRELIPLTHVPPPLGLLATLLPHPLWLKMSRRKRYKLALAKRSRALADIDWFGDGA